MSFQYTYDAKGNAIGVFVPIEEWEKLTGFKKGKTTKSTGAGKTATLKNIEKGMKQVGQIEKGKLKSIPLNQLLDEL